MRKHVQLSRTRVTRINEDAFGANGGEIMEDWNGRVENAADCLIDWVYVHSLDDSIPNQDRLYKIRRMVAEAMIAQYDHDQKKFGEMIADMTD